MESRLEPYKIPLSAPHFDTQSIENIRQLLQSATFNWNNLSAFEEEFAAYIETSHATAVNSGTAALHLALLVLGVGYGDEVLVSNFTFCASVNPILYVGAKPILIGSEACSWNLDANILEDVLRQKQRLGKLPKALILVHLYGQAADVDVIKNICDYYGVYLIEDAAEALGTTYKNQQVGIKGNIGVFSFNTNKMLTTTGGGMLVSENVLYIQKAAKLATQAREKKPYYHHNEVGYNYQLSNLLASLGRGQLQFVQERVLTRRQIFNKYKEALGDVKGIDFMPEAPWGRHSRWLTCLTIDPDIANVNVEDIRLSLQNKNIESRPLWKPMHLQPVFSHYETYHSGVETSLFQIGICLPSGSSLTTEQLNFVISSILEIIQ